MLYLLIVLLLHAALPVVGAGKYDHTTLILCDIPHSSGYRCVAAGYCSKWQIIPTTAPRRRYAVYFKDVYVPITLLICFRSTLTVATRSSHGHWARTKLGQRSFYTTYTVGSGPTPVECSTVWRFKTSKFCHRQNPNMQTNKMWTIAPSTVSNIVFGMLSRYTPCPEKN